MSDTILTRAFLQHQGELIGFFRGRLSCAETAKDLCQEVFIRLQRTEDPAAIENCRSYIFKVARNLLKDHIRNETRRAELLREVGVVPWDRPLQPTPEQVLSAHTELEQLKRVIPGLPVLSRRIFHRHRFQDKTRKEIAAEFGVSLTTVENHIRLVLEHMSHALDDEAPNA